jgi:hypothetical protein
MDQPLDDHREYQIARARPFGREHRVETEAPDHPDDRLDVAMSPRSEVSIVKSSSARTSGSSRSTRRRASTRAGG